MYQLVTFLFAIFIGIPLAFSDDKKQPAKVQCEKVMAIVAVETGRSFGETPCKDNTYSKAFWVCVEERMESGTGFNFALQRCERSVGLDN